MVRLCWSCDQWWRGRMGQLKIEPFQRESRIQSTRVSPTLGRDHELSHGGRHNNHWCKPQEDGRTTEGKKKSRHGILGPVVPSPICWRKAVDIDRNEGKSTLKSLNRCVWTEVQNFHLPSNPNSQGSLSTYPYISSNCSNSLYEDANSAVTVALLGRLAIPISLPSLRPLLLL